MMSQKHQTWDIWKMTSYILSVLRKYSDSSPLLLSTCHGFNIVLGSGHYSLSPMYIIEKAT